MLKLQIILALGILTCGQILFWRRRDNLFGYFQVGLYVATVLVPIVGTTVLDTADQTLVNRYAAILTVGAAAYLFGLCCGAPIGFHSRRPRVSFAEAFTDIPQKLVRRARFFAILALVGLIGAFALLGYTPLLAENRLAAKYGVGAYRAGFQRGSQLFNVALTLASAIAAVTLALAVVRRKRLDIALTAALLIGMALTLSRGRALAGPLAFLIAWGIQRRWRPAHLVVIACLSFTGGALVNELAFVETPVASASFASRVARTVPDIADQLAFLQGYTLLGEEQVGLKTIRAGLSLSPTKGHWDPSDYALRMRTGLTDVSELPSGGLRLPAPIWGFSAYGYAGVAVWSFVSGFFMGWGTTLFRRLLSKVESGRYPNQALNLVLAWVFFNGTFGVLTLFFFPSRSDVVVVALALGLGLLPRRASVETSPGSQNVPPATAVRAGMA